MLQTFFAMSQHRSPPPSVPLQLLSPWLPPLPMTAAPPVQHSPMLPPIYLQTLENTPIKKIARKSPESWPNRSYREKAHLLDFLKDVLPLRSTNSAVIADQRNGTDEEMAIVRKLDSLKTDSTSWWLWWRAPGSKMPSSCLEYETGGIEHQQKGVCRSYRINFQW